MDLDSPLFDRIRVRPRAEEVQPASVRLCEHAGCRNAGEFRAPKGRNREGQFWHFCLEHVRDYNKTYNYFAGLPDDSVSAYQRDAATGHRPTWTMGVNPWAKKRGEGPQPGPEIHDGFGFFDEDHGFRRPQRAPEPERRRLKLLERKALDALDLPETATGPEIKARYKTLVKRLHPDANGGDRSSEDKLRGIIQAYNTLRSAGLC
ncbi:J domain-containing protein [Labrys sp. LIt4]|uniref:Molecular chaperone DnaJ n=1 Tax=Labrys okinawensis TaxID=346911 RepID=A0A2S9QHS6_9HYPH|nr:MULTISPECIES: J domain-containing protein [Labrys]MBP0582488.1 J domain-containing protein [Labrys sp. LIt4]PRH88917.1 molecular chaperone DnaJ [Labrys okinawensis]